MHSANKLGRDASLRTGHLPLSAKTRKGLEHAATPLGAVILDEFPQCIAQMLHADALRKTYGRQAAYNLEVYRNSASQETWGRMPAVVIAGMHRDQHFTSVISRTHVLFLVLSFLFHMSILVD